MFKRLLTTLLVLAIGTGAGFALGIFVYPYWFLADIVAADSTPATGRKVASGKFVHVNPKDPIHYGKGAVTVYEGSVHLESDFEVGPGPKFHVYLVPETPVTAERQVTQSMFIDLGRLRAFKGSQNYSIPAGVDLKRYPSVVIWCEQFSVLITAAALEYRN
jgi:hypothetical protein